MIPYQNIEIDREIRNMKFRSSTETFTGILDLYEEGGMANY